MKTKTRTIAIAVSQKRTRRSSRSVKSRSVIAPSFGSGTAGIGGAKGQVNDITGGRGQNQTAQGGNLRQSTANRHPALPAPQTTPPKVWRGSKQTLGMLRFINLAQLRDSCKPSLWMGLGAKALLTTGAFMTAFLYIFERALLDGQGLWSLSTPAPWWDLRWRVF